MNSKFQKSLETLEKNHAQKLDIEIQNIDQCKQFTQRLAHNTSLHSLEVQGKITNLECKYFGEALKMNQTLLHLSFSLGSFIAGIEGLKYINESLKVNHSLIEFIFSSSNQDDSVQNQDQNEIRLEIMKKLELNKVNLIHIKKTLQLKWEEINVSKNSLRTLIIENIPIKQFKANLIDFSHLVVLDLRNNDLDSEFIHSLCQFIQWNNCLKVINLQDNKNIGDKDGNEILSAILLNVCLIGCNLNGTSISKELQERIGNKIKANSSVNSLFFKYSDLAHLIIINQVAEVKEIWNKYTSLESFEEILFLCCAWDRTELCELILQSQNIKINTSLNGNTYLHFSVMNDNYKLSRLLIEKGIDINILNNEEKTSKNYCLSDGECKSLFEDIKQLKVVILGKAMSGKTTLTKKISKIKETKPNQVYNKFFQSKGGGMEMHEWKTGSNNIIQLWDFEGQELFYSTYQLFLSKNSIYLLLFNLNDKSTEKELFFWLNSIQYRAPKSKVIIVGSHMDKIDPKLLEEELNLTSTKIKNIYDKVTFNFAEKTNNNNNENNSIELIPCPAWECIKSKSFYGSNDKSLWFYPISGKDGWNIKYLEEQLRKFSFENIVSKEFVKLTEKIISIRNEKLNSKMNLVLSREELIKVILEYFNNEEEEIEKNLKLLHELGYILDFGAKDIIIDPLWFFTMFKALIPFKNLTQFKDGIVSTFQITQNLEKGLADRKKNDNKKSKIDLLSKISASGTEGNYVFETLDENVQIELQLKLFQLLGMCVSYKDEEILIPCLINSEKPKSLDFIFEISLLTSTSNLDQNTRENKEILGRKYLFPFIPRGIFENILVKVYFFIGPIIKFWKNGFYITANEGKAHLMFEIKLAEYDPQKNKIPKSNNPNSFYQAASFIYVKSVGTSSYHLISAFHFCIKELFEKNYPLLWNDVKIEIEYFHKEDKFTNSRENCLQLWKKKNSEPIKTMNGYSIDWNKLIPEKLEISNDYENNNNISSFDTFKFEFMALNKLEEGPYGQVYVSKFFDRPGLFTVQVLKESKHQRSRRHKEFEIMKELNHPNILKLLGYYSTNNDPYLILLFPFYHNSLRGIQDQIYEKFIQPLKLTRFPLKNKEVKDNYWWKQKEILFFYEGILKGLEYLHSKSITHLNLKLENILVTLDGNKLKMNENDERFNIKSIHIHAHKLEEKKKKDMFKDDIFSFGILFYEIIANTPRLSLADQKKLSELKGHDFEEVILNCLKEDPNQRPTIEKLLQFQIKKKIEWYNFNYWISF